MPKYIRRPNGTFEVIDDDTSTSSSSSSSTSSSTPSSYPYPRSRVSTRSSSVSVVESRSKTCSILIPSLLFIIGQIVQYVVYTVTGHVLVFDLVFRTVPIGVLIVSTILGTISTILIIVQSWKMIDDGEYDQAWIYIVVGSLCFAVLPCLSGYIGIIITLLIKYCVDEYETEYIFSGIIGTAFVLGQVLQWVNYSRTGSILLLTNLVENSSVIKINPLTFSIWMSVILGIACLVFNTAARQEPICATFLVVPFVVFAIVVPTVTALPLLAYAGIFMMLDSHATLESTMERVACVLCVLIVILLIVLSVLAGGTRYIVVLDAQGGSSGTDTVSAGYNKNLPRATPPERPGYTFDGYWDRISGGTQYYDASMKSVKKWDRKEEGILYAHWTVKKYTVRFDKQGGTGGSDSVLVEYQANMPSASPPRKNGYSFRGYYSMLDGTGTRYYDERMNSLRRWDNTEDGVLYACWVSSLVLSASPSSLSSLSGTTVISLTVSGGSGQYTFKLDRDKYSGISCSLSGNNLSVTKTDNNASGSIIVRVSDNVYGTTASRTISYSTSGCVAAGTPVMMADGTTKKIEDVRPGEMIMSWNYMTGQAEAAPVSLYWYHGDDLYRVICLSFSDGTEVRVINTHGFFDATDNRFVYISRDNCYDLIGHEFICLGAECTPQRITLQQVTVTEELVGSYSLRTACNDNAILAGLISLTWEDYVGMLTFFEVGDGLQYNTEKMQSDIERFGLYTYEEWADYISYDEFVALNGQYFKILVGKGILLEEDIFALIDGMRSD